MQLKDLHVGDLALVRQCWRGTASWAPMQVELSGIVINRAHTTIYTREGTFLFIILLLRDGSDMMFVDDIPDYFYECELLGPAAGML